MTVHRWQGTFGDLYVERNLSALSLPKRGQFWDGLFTKYPVESVIEVGSGAGANLRHLRAKRIVGVDVNESALKIARLLPDVLAIRADAARIPLPDQAFEMSLCVGLLIHIPDHELLNVMDELWRLSSKYIFVGEYDAPRTTEVEYRGERGLLWKRPYRDLFLARFVLTAIDEGFLAQEDGFDNVTWTLFQK